MNIQEDFVKIMFPLAIALPYRKLDTDEKLYGIFDLVKNKNGFTYKLSQISSGISENETWEQAEYAVSMLIGL